MGLFDEQFRLEEISQMGDPLESLSKAIDFESFSELISRAFVEVNRTKGGRPRYDKSKMFKCLVLKHTYGISFGRLEFLIRDRLSFQRFIGLTLEDRVPDANTIWDFNEALVRAGVIDKIFELFTHQLREKGMILNKGSIVDASIINAPVQRNTREENGIIKTGDTPQEWSDKKRQHKDADATWVKKHGTNRYGYKNHIKVDKKSKLITTCEITSASVHDSQVLGLLLEQSDNGHELYGDAAYRSAEIEELLRSKNIRSKIHKKANRRDKLTGEEKMMNTNRSRVRSRVEHIFGNIKQTIGQVMVRQVSLTRNRAAIIMMNLGYNFRRYIYLMKISVPN